MNYTYELYIVLEYDANTFVISHKWLNDRHCWVSWSNMFFRGSFGELARDAANGRIKRSAYPEFFDVLVIKDRID